MKLESKYNIGDTVYTAQTKTIKTQVQCPDCLGRRTVEVYTRSGEVYETSCPACESGYFSTGTLPVSEVKGTFAQLTIGRVSFEQDFGGEDDTQTIFKYMCEETGIGSGSVYAESALFLSPEEAQAEGDRRAQNEQTQNEQTAAAQLADRRKLVGRRGRCPYCSGSGTMSRSEIARTVAKGAQHG